VREKREDQKGVPVVDRDSQCRDRLRIGLREEILSHYLGHRYLCVFLYTHDIYSVCIRMSKSIGAERDGDITEETFKTAKMRFWTTVLLFTINSNLNQHANYDTEEIIRPRPDTWGKYAAFGGIRNKCAYTIPIHLR
jgi:hypothetical protein